MEKVTECVNCGLAVPQNAEYCAACGTEYASGVKGKGPFTFAFEETKSAYIPSGKTTPKAVVLLVVASLILIPILGFIAYGADWVVSQISLAISRDMPFIAVLAGIMMWFFAGGGIGILEGLVMAEISKRGTNRSPKLAALIGGFVGFAGGLMLFMWRKQFLGATGGNSMIDIAKVIIYALSMGLAGWMVSEGNVKRQMFCEKCSKFLKSKTARAHLSEEKKLYGLLSSKAFAQVAEDPNKTDDPDNYSLIDIYTCPDCGEGYVELTSVQTRLSAEKNNNSKKETRRKLILSMFASSEEITRLLAQLQHA